MHDAFDHDVDGNGFVPSRELDATRSQPEDVAHVVVFVIPVARRALRVEDTTEGWSDQPDSETPRPTATR